MKTLKLPITNGTFSASDVTVSGTNDSTTHNVYVAFTQANSGYVAIQYKVSGSNNWQPMGKVDLTDTEVATFKVSGIITDWRFVVAGASGTGSIEVTDSEKLEDIHPLSFYGETGGMSPGEIGGGLFRAYKSVGSPVLAFCGDSITANSYSLADDIWVDYGWVCWLRRYLGVSADTSSRNMFAVGGMGTEHLLTTQLPALLSSDATHVFLMVGTNDIGGSVDVVGNVGTFIDAATKSGRVVIVQPIIPRVSGWDATVKKKVDSINSGIFEKCRTSPGVFFIDSTDIFTDYSDGDAVPELFYDSVHPNKQGAKLIADRIFSKLPFAYGSQIRMLEVSGGLYDSTTNPTGNWLANGLMSGSFGTLVSATGTASDGVTVVGNAGFSVVSSVTADTTLTGKTNQVITLSGTGNGQTFAIGMPFSLSDLPPGISTGDMVEAIAEVECASLSGVAAMYFSLYFDTSVSRDGETSATKGSINDFSGTMRVTKQIQDGASQYKLILWGLTESGSALSGSVLVRNVSIRKFNAGA